MEGNPSDLGNSRKVTLNNEGIKLETSQPTAAAGKFNSMFTDVHERESAQF